MNARKQLMVLALALVSMNSFAQVITVGADSFYSFEKFYQSANKKELNAPVLGRTSGGLITKLSPKMRALLGKRNHEVFHRCSGYAWHASIDEAKSFLRKSQSTPKISFEDIKLVDYDINQQAQVNPLIEQISAQNMLSTITSLSGFHDRYYTRQSGVDAAQWIANEVKSLIGDRSDVTVELRKHSWAQPSVIVTMAGASSDKIIVGGHLDSINQGSIWGPSNKPAPGADDNASGTATWMEVLRVLLKNNYRPQNTLQFMGYAAEEVGLLGSRDIAKGYQAQKEVVLGVLQFDMTNFKNDEKEIYLISDYTNKAQNKFLGDLIDTYLKIPWGYTACGYACSDHASWTGQGFPASFPFETSFERYNHAIHSEKDTLNVSNNSADHAAKFARLGLAYVLELDN